ncbi:hypothetical protein F0562_027356 [Nyssa sinensis]|uniref:Uncharacterized protein n=1 Tax=Nyssa sinensis TaxID=561372 RepID=A0A5J5B668_9ASTE|nr:hypothetical protein F0562_027356 [Nyssa sinensis]
MSVPNSDPTQGNVDLLLDLKRQRIEDISIATVVEEKKSLALDKSQTLFQQLWTDEKSFLSIEIGKRKEEMNPLYGIYEAMVRIPKP